MNQLERINYLEAFDVPAFLYAERADAITASVQKIRVQCLVIEVPNAQSFCQAGKTQDFLLKMLSAIGLQKSDIKCISVENNNLTHTLGQYDAKVVLSMSKGLALNANNHFVTHHPSDILTNDTLKREAWEVLKKVQVCLK
ncbi:hypothetical protein [Bathymodiolus thermophilus thioautotrophic gill symbiont]|uniref:Uncharacterized protein n=1 Tax=Bathymodiolus thermophilus thioautotrophic gill symbiont TaxID=2360 RepID=A0A1J5TTB5_9GAMM|nr:hypothetical protein [Bathymodiolus thermophilus thioautotrophic gill symbiont]OIR24099.1 hypothetical protein BGC33_09375 [Bathymodiolus thermophilus thioautotrophic gill symbiont]